MQNFVFNNRNILVICKLSRIDGYVLSGTKNQHDIHAHMRFESVKQLADFHPYTLLQIFVN